jgi:hypothetical protein
MSTLADGHFDLREKNEVSDIAEAAAMVMRIEDFEARFLGKRIEEVRPSIAARVRTGSETLKNIRSQRRKAIPAWLKDAIRKELIRILQREANALENEIKLHTQTGSSHRSDDLAKAQAQLDAARKILRGG